MFGLTFDQLCEMEPKLREVEASARAFVARGGSGSDGYEVFKRRLLLIVGFRRVGEEPSGHPLRTDTAYMVAIERITDVLNF